MMFSVFVFVDLPVVAVFDIWCLTVGVSVSIQHNVPVSVFISTSYVSVCLSVSLSVVSSTGPSFCLFEITSFPKWVLIHVYGVY